MPLHGRTFPRRRLRRTFEALEQRRLLAVITVNTGGDSNARDNVLTLREAIALANGTLDPATLDAAEAGQVVGTINSGPANRDEIRFNLPSATNGTFFVALVGGASITDPVIIDGYTQPGARPNTLAVGTDAVVNVQIVFSGGGFVLTSGDTLIRGLSMGNATSIEIRSSNNVIEGNYIGVSADGLGSTEAGLVQLWVRSGSNNLIGGTTPAARNVIAGGFNNNGGTLQVGGINGQVPSQTRIQGNYIGTNADGTARVGSGGENGIVIFSGLGTLIGGDDAADGSQDGVAAAGNLVAGLSNHGIKIGASLAPAGEFDGVTIQGNRVGTTADGAAALPNFIGIGTDGSRVDQGLIQIGGTTPGAGNLVAGNRGTGIAVNAVRVRIEGNRVGTDAAGATAIPNRGGGIAIELGGSGTPDFDYVVGGDTPSARNVVSGNGTSSNPADGVRISGIDSGSVILQGNAIGVDVNGGPLPNAGNGVSVLGRPALIGGVATGEGNVIAFNGGAGVAVRNAADGSQGLAAILGNSIYDNDGLGISLTGGAPTFNDDGPPPDADQGPNDLQNFPALTTALTNAGALRVAGTLDSTPSTSFRIEIFTSPAADPSGFGEGQTYIGSTEVRTDAQGHATFDLVFPAPAGAGLPLVVTSTTTRIAQRSVEQTTPGRFGPTSEFSHVLHAEGGPTSSTDLNLAAFADPPSVAPGQDISFRFDVTNPPTGSDASNVVFTTQIPANMTFVSIDVPGAATATTPPVGGTGTVTVTLPTLAADETLRVILVARVKPGVAGGTSLVAQGSVTSDTPDPNTADNSASATVTVAGESLPSVDASVAATASPTTAVPGQDVTFTFVVATPNDASNIQNARLAVDIPANMTFVSFTAPAGYSITAPPVGGTGQVVATIGTLVQNAADTFTLVARVNPGVHAGTVLTARGTLAADSPDPDSSNNAASAAATVHDVQPPGDLTSPTVASVARYGFHRQATYLVVTFSEPMDSAAAANPAHYLVTAHGLRIAPASVVYNPESNQAVLRMASRLSVFRAYRLTLSGAGLRDLAGNPLDGDRDGTPGGDARITINRRRLAGTEADALALLPPGVAPTLHHPRGPRAPRRARA